MKLSAGAAAAFTVGCAGDDSGDDTAAGSTSGTSTAGDHADHADHMMDTAMNDTAMNDTAMNDTGMMDTGMPDTGMPDTGMADTGDTGMNDTGMMESGTDSGSGSGSGSTGAAFDCTQDPEVVIGNPHSHEMVVTAEEIAAGAEVVYNIQGQNEFHGHTVTLTEADFMTLASTGTVQVQSSDSGHTHPVTVTC